MVGIPGQAEFIAQFKKIYHRKRKEEKWLKQNEFRPLQDVLYVET